MRDDEACSAGLNGKHRPAADKKQDRVLRGSHLPQAQWGRAGRGPAPKRPPSDRSKKPADDPAPVRMRYGSPAFTSAPQSLILLGTARALSAFSFVEETPAPRIHAAASHRAGPS